jgi:small subunit ribosomal protein S20
MPITSSAKKAMRQSNKKRILNKGFKDDMKISLAVFEKKITKKQSITAEDLNTVCARIDKALKKRILHKNTAARRKSLVTRMFNAIEK